MAYKSPSSNPILSLVTATTPSPFSAASCSCPGRARQLQSHLLAAGTATEVLLFHAASPRGPLLVVSMMRALREPLLMQMELWSTVLPVAEGTGHCERAVQGIQRSAHEPAVGHGTGVLHAPACVGVISVTCATTGVTAVHAFAALPPALGLQLRRASETEQSEPNSKTARRSLLADTKRVGGSSVEVATAPVVQPASAQSAGQPPVWQLASSVAVAQLGASQLIGHRVADLLASSPEASELVATVDSCKAVDATADASSAPLPVRDIIGACVLPATRADTPAGDCCGTTRQQAAHAETRGKPSCDATAGLQAVMAAWGRGEEGGCFAELRRQMPSLCILRCTPNGSPVLQRFEWQTQRVWHASVAEVNAVALQGAQAPSGQERQEYASSFWHVARPPGQKPKSAHPYDVQEAVCAKQMQRFWHAWRCDAFDGAAMLHWRCTPEAALLLPVDSGGAARLQEQLRQHHCTAIVWPFEHADVPPTNSVTATPRLAAALRALLGNVTTCTTAADLWLGALAMCSASSLGGVSGAGQAACPNVTHTVPAMCDGIDVCAGNDCADATLADMTARVGREAGLPGALAAAQPCGSIPGRVIAGAVNCVAIQKQHTAPALPEAASLALAADVSRLGVGAAGGHAGSMEARTRSVLATIAAAMCELGPACGLQLHALRTPAWLPQVAVLPCGERKRSRATLNARGRPSLSAEGGGSLHEWLIMPVAARHTAKLGRFEAEVGDGLLPKMTNAVTAKLAELGALWGSRGTG